MLGNIGLGALVIWMNLHFLTNFGDQAVIVPLLAVTGLALFLMGWRRAALAWCLVVPATLGVVLVSKLSVIACNELLPSVGLLSPSGHTASAAVVYGGLLTLMLRGRARSWSLVAGGAVLAAGLFAVLIGFTRVALNVHTLADVLAGGAIGIAGVVVLAWLAGPRPALPRAWMGLTATIATVMVVAVLFHGRHVYAERHIGALSQQIWPLTLCSGSTI